MKTCEKCNLTYADDKKFCLKCGAPLTMIHQIEPKEVAKKNVFEDRLKADPLNVEILHDYAQFLFNNLLFSEANTVSLKILAIKDNDGTAKELLFKSYFKLNLFKEASEIGIQLLSEKPTDIFLLQELAIISAKMGDSDKVTEYYDKILKLQPSHSVALYNKAQNLLAENQIEKAIEIFKNLYLGGQSDRITIIYVAINKALIRDYEVAIKLLSPILSNEKLDQNDINSNRGVIYLAYSLSKSSAGLPEIKKWIANINLKTLKQNYHPSDEQIIVEIVEYLVNKSLKEINQSSDFKNKISELSKSYIGDGYFTANSNSKIAELWYAVGSKQVEMKLLVDAIVSFQKAVGLCPSQNKYNQKLASIVKTLNDKKREKSRKTNIIVLTSVVAFVVIAVVIFIYKNFAENKAWETANRTNTMVSVHEYLISYPNGKFLKEAEKLFEKFGVTDIDGNVYHTVTIGTQVWLTENLKTTKYRDGSPIPNVSDSSTWVNLNTGAYCNSNNDADIGAKYGRLYNWYAVNDNRNIAPKGWHVATDAEWTTLENYVSANLGTSGSVAKALASKTEWASSTLAGTIGYDLTKNNTTGLNLLPGDGCIHKAAKVGIGDNGLWWTSTESDGDDKAIMLWLYCNFKEPFHGRISKSGDNSVRCIKD